MIQAPPITDELVPPFLDILQKLREVCRGDLEKNIILLAIAERTVRHPEFRKTTDAQRLDGSLPAFPNTGVNALSIAESSGIPRETVRRKIADLRAAGWICRKGRNLHYTPAGYQALTSAREALEQLAVRFTSIMERRRLRAVELPKAG
jgi:hypothetical protein